MNIGNKISDLRKRDNITQDALAEILHVSPQAISKWERGVANPDLALIPQIAKIFHISSDELLGIDQKSNTSKVNKRLDYLERIITAVSAGNEAVAQEALLEDARCIAKFDFTQMSDDEKKDWVLDGGVMLENEGTIKFNAVPIERNIGGGIYDPHVIFSNINLNAREISTLVISLKTTGGAYEHDCMFYFATRENPGFNQSKTVRQRYLDGQKVTLHMPIHNNLFYGTLTHVRIDPSYTNSSECEIDFIQLIDHNGEVRWEADFTSKNPYPTESIKFVNAERIEKDGALAFKIIPYYTKKAVFDPLFENSKVNIDISEASHVHVRLKTTLDNPEARGWYSNNVFYNAVMKIYFKNDISKEYGENKAVSVPYFAGRTIDLYADMTQNGYWNGQLTGLRIDPIEGTGGTFEIELIEILKNTSKLKIGGFVKSMESKLHSLIEDIESRCDDLEGQIGDLEGQIEDFESKIEELESQIEELTNRLKESED